MIMIMRMILKLYVLSVPLCTTVFRSGHDIGFGAGGPGFESVYLSCRTITRISICWTLGGVSGAKHC